MNTGTKLAGLALGTGLVLWLALRPSQVEAFSWFADFKVTDEETGAPLSGAVITISGISRTTGAGGTTTFGLASSGTYAFSITCLGYEAVSGSFDAVTPP